MGGKRKTLQADGAPAGETARGDSNDADVGQRIRLRRVELGMSQASLGEAIGVSFQQVQKYEKGKNRISAGRLQTLADILQVKPAYFFGGSSKQREAQSIMAVDAKFNMRLIRAYNAIPDNSVRHRLVALMETIAGFIPESVATTIKK